MRRQGDKERGRGGDKETHVFSILLVSLSPLLPVFAELPAGRNLEK
jgi:hypothetical protein